MIDNTINNKQNDNDKNTKQIKGVTWKGTPKSITVKAGIIVAIS